MTRIQTRPVLRYHGGKWRIAPWVMSHFPPHRIYVEPFGGAGSVLMLKPRVFGEVYNDLDEGIVNVFRVLRDPAAAAELQRLVELTPWSRIEFEKSYEPTLDPIELARREIARSFMAHGTTSRRQNRTGFRARARRIRISDAVSWGTYPEQLERYVERLRGVCIECQHAFKVIQQQDCQQTLFYCDPPYPASTRSSIRCAGEHERGSRAYMHELFDDDHRALANMLHRVKGMVVLSGYPCELYDRELYPDWVRVEKQARADKAQPRTEVMWINPACAEALDRHRGDLRIAA
jgi:DNA adenine methylase